MLEKGFHRLLELVNGLVSEAKLLDVKYEEGELPNLNIKPYLVELLKAIGFDRNEIQFDYRETYMGDVVRFTLETAAVIDVPRSVITRAMIYSKLLTLGTEILDYPDHLLDDEEITKWMEQIAGYFKLSRVYESYEVRTAVSGDPELYKSYLAAFHFWSDDKSLHECIRQIATLYLPSNGFRRETILKRAIMAQALLKKETTK